MNILRFRTLALPVMALVLSVPAMPQGKGKGGDNDPDRAVAGGGLPAGWSARPDRGGADQEKVTQQGGVMHFTMGPAAVFYNNSWTKTGDYKYSARVKMTKPPTHPTSYGLMIGGKDLGGATPVYTYFLVRNQGEYFIANQDGQRTIVTNWTKNPAIKTGDADVLEVEVKGADVIFRVNGQEVAKLPKAQLHTDGLIGFRVGHNIDVDIDEVKR